MVVAIVREAGQVVLGDNEPLDTWAVVLSGTVIEPDGTIRELTRGDAFGVRPGREDRTHRGVMRTVTEDCQFACVPQADYLQIMSREGEAEIPEMGEGGRVVLVYEALETDTSTVRPTVSKSMESTTTVLPKKGRVVTKGTPEKLIEHLVADLSNVDITYPEDFLLTYRTFLESPAPIVDRLLSWHMHAPHLRARVNRIVILWVHNHFNDFEDSPEMMKFVEKFDRILVTDGTGECALPFIQFLICLVHLSLSSQTHYLPLRSGFI
ncbi:cyclic nucleotide-binding domain protein [Opisthorchis viverrini]|uniref:Cyclic nucleotide-binding domain protein n=1 Tax=Opisthorchis viverrini TaxID=6198 RepID=A0A1S8WS15_OPIVI|nr:cyclic nucleotide-binding domain protein [Opisthorchis viverrini]